MTCGHSQPCTDQSRSVRASNRRPVSTNDMTALISATTSSPRRSSIGALATTVLEGNNSPLPRDSSAKTAMKRRYLVIPPASSSPCVRRIRERQLRKAGELLDESLGERLAAHRNDGELLRGRGGP